MAGRSWKQQWYVESYSDPDKEYTVSEDYDGSFACSCPAWKFHTPRTDCKHIKAIKNRRYSASRQEAQVARSAATPVPRPAPAPAPAAVAAPVVSSGPVNETIRVVAWDL